MPLARPRARDAGVVAQQIRIPVHDEEAIAEQRQCAAQGPAGALELVVRVVDAHSVRRAVAEHRFDLIGEMRDTHHDARDPRGAQQRGLVDDERCTRDLEQRFRDLLGDVTEACREPTGEDRAGRHHEKTTRVPSKSNRNRTSSSCASAIAARTRFGSGA